MLLSELLASLPTAHACGPTDIAVTSLAYDSRRVRPDGLFVAIVGYHTDGHRYIPQALERGAAAVVVDERSLISDPSTIPGWLHQSLVVVPNSQIALAPLAAAFYGYPGRELGVVGVTGTKGKSTTTDLVNQVLEGGGYTTGMISTVDFKIGARRWANDTRQSTPEAPEIQSLLREMAQAGCDYAVIEATSHALSRQLNRLEGCNFDVALFLNLGHEHLDFHGTFEQYRRDKCRLFEFLGEEIGDTRGEFLEESAQSPSTRRQFPGAKRERWAIANADDPNHAYFLDAAPAAARHLTYAINAAADVRAYDVTTSPEGARFRVATPWGNGAVSLRLPGAFNVFNALAALSVALTQHVPLERAITALEAVGGIRGRMERIVEGQPFEVIVDYAHNPDSFEQVMGMLRPLTAGRMIAVFGSAGERDREKRPIQGAIAARYCELLVLTDEDPRGEDRDVILAEIAAGVPIGHPCLRIPDRARAIRAAFADARPGDLVLLLGKGHEGCIIYADHTLPWDESAEALAALRELGTG